MPYSVKKIGVKWCVIKVDGKKIGCHDSKDDAENQRTAIIINEGTKK